MNVLNFGSSLGRSEMKKYYLVLFTIFLFACSSQEPAELPEHVKKLDNVTVYSSNPEPERQIGLEREQVIGNTDNHVVIVGGGEGIGVDEAGRVFIADREQFTIHVFQPDGSYITSMGRKGKGPGEFISLASIKNDSHYLYAYDSLQLRLNIYSLDSLTFLRTINLDPTNWKHIEELRMKGLDDYFVNKDGAILGKFTPSIKEIMNSQGTNYFLSYYYLDRQGMITSDLIFRQAGRPYESVDFQGSQFSIALSFMRKPLIALSDDGHIYSAWSENILIKKYNPEGQYLRAYYYPYKKPLLHREDVVKMNDIGYKTPNTEYIQHADLPKTWPALSSMQMDDENRLWVSVITKNFDVNEWWILKDTGELLAKFTWPRNKIIEEIKNGYMYTRETEEETGLQQVVRYQIEMN